MRIFTLLLSFLLTSSVFGQTDWLPIPIDQTSYFENDDNHRILPMKNDQYFLLANGVQFQVYGQFILNEFDTCAFHVWDTDGMNTALPAADFKMFDANDADLVVYGIEAQFHIPVKGSLNDEVSFYQNYTIRYESIAEQSVLGEMDSVKTFSILNASTVIGVIELSKHHGFVHFLSFRDLEQDEPDIREYSVLGTKDQNNVSLGFAIPEQELDYLPYTAGDKLLIKYEYWGVDNGDWNLVTEFHSLELNATFNSTLNGVCTKYSSQGVFIEVDSAYELTFNPMLSELVANFVSVPFSSATDNQAVMANISSFVSQDSGLVATISGYESGFCSGDIVDGYGQTQTFSTEFGLLYKQNGGFGPPSTWTLYAAEGENFTYGTWPEWLGVSDVNLKQTKVFPNPAKDVLHITGSTQNAQIQLFDLAGKLIYTSKENLPATIHLDEFSRGLYFLNVSADGLGAETHKIIVD